MSYRFNNRVDITDHLPLAAVNKGCTLEYEGPIKQDPVYLYSHHELLFRWDYVPSQGEVWDKCRELNLME
jgi:hypothetical protein